MSVNTIPVGTTTVSKPLTSEKKAEEKKTEGKNTSIYNSLKEATVKCATTIETQSEKALASNDSKPKLTAKQLTIQRIARKQAGEFLEVKVTPEGDLIITANHKRFGLFNDPHSERSMGAIRGRLALNKGVIGKHNPEVYDRFSNSIQRGYGSTPDDGILAPGESIKIPASEVGKNPNIVQWWKGTFDDISKH